MERHITDTFSYRFRNRCQLIKKRASLLSNKISFGRFRVNQKGSEYFLIEGENEYRSNS